MMKDNTPVQLAEAPISTERRKLFMGLAAGAGVLMAPRTLMAHIPKPGEPQHNLLKPYEQFIMHMQMPDSGSSCCNLLDGRGNLPERKSGEGNPADPGYFVNEEYPYRVLVTHHLNNTPLEGGPVWVKIPKGKVLTATFANAVCKPFVDADPEKSTCITPPFNIIWMNPHNRDSISVYCYWPKPSQG